MNLNDLAQYTMNEQEQNKWNALTTLVKDYCDQDILEQFKILVESTLLTLCIEDHIAGYSQEDGYYYIIEADYGEYSFGCLTNDEHEMAFYILKNIYYSVASDIELKNRTIYQSEWEYYHEKNAVTEDIEWKHNTEFKFNGYYDPRIYVYDYVIKKLMIQFKDSDYFNKMIQEYQDYLNLWFDDVHWKFDNEQGMFIEVSDSVDNRFRKK